MSSTNPAIPAAGDGTCLLGGGNTASYGSTTVSGITITAGSSVVNDAKATLKNEGQQVTFGATVSLHDGSNSSYTGPVYVGDVSDTAQNAVKGGSVDVGAFELVDAARQPGDGQRRLHRFDHARRADARRPTRSTTPTTRRWAAATPARC